MSPDQQRYATYGLMCSLILSGAIGTWISIGGTYYLISMAFSAANMFVLTRLIGGLAFTLAGCVLGFVIISVVESVALPFGTDDLPLSVGSSFDLPDTRFELLEWTTDHNHGHTDFDDLTTLDNVQLQGQTLRHLHLP
jgi:hypothetical protein